MKPLIFLPRSADLYRMVAEHPSTKRAHMPALAVVTASNAARDRPFYCMNFLSGETGSDAIIVNDHRE
jgi:hypothetical protein